MHDQQAAPQQQAPVFAVWPGGCWGAGGADAGVRYGVKCIRWCERLFGGPPGVVHAAAHAPFRFPLLPAGCLPEFVFRRALLLASDDFRTIFVKSPLTLFAYYRAPRPTSAFTCPAKAANLPIPAAALASYGHLE
jgi:hypothetical protein